MEAFAVLVGDWLISANCPLVETLLRLLRLANIPPIRLPLQSDLVNSKSRKISRLPESHKPSLVLVNEPLFFALPSPLIHVSVRLVVVGEIARVRAGRHARRYPRGFPSLVFGDAISSLQGCNLTATRSPGHSATGVYVCSRAPVDPTSKKTRVRWSQGGYCPFFNPFPLISSEPSDRRNVYVRRPRHTGVRVV